MSYLVTVDAPPEKVYIDKIMKDWQAKDNVNVVGLLDCCRKATHLSEGEKGKDLDDPLIPG